MNDIKAAVNRIHFDSPIGVICAEDNGDALTALYVDREKNTDYDRSSDLLIRVENEINEYFCGKRFDFDIPLCLNGTRFQLSVWQALLNIPYAQTVSYSDVAKSIGKPNACRAAGGAIGKNPIMIIIPCHRVIGKGGGLVGFSSGIDVKRTLLDVEKKFGQARKADCHIANE